MTTSFFRLPRKNRSRGFTLVEMLVVMAIIAILTVMSVAAFTQITRGQAITMSAQILQSALNLARQTAISRNNYVEFRIYQVPDPNNPATSVFRGFQTFLVTGTASEAGATGVTPLTKATFLPRQVIIAPNGGTATVGGTKELSTLVDPSQDISLTPISGTTATAPLYAQSIPTYGTAYSAVCFRFTPQGSLQTWGTAGTPPGASTALSTSISWYLTILMEPVAASPKNFATIQLDPFTGRARIFRP